MKKIKKTIKNYKGTWDHLTFPKRAEIISATVFCLLSSIVIGVLSSGITTGVTFLLEQLLK